MTENHGLPRHQVGGVNRESDSRPRHHKNLKLKILNLNDNIKGIFSKFN